MDWHCFIREFMSKPSGLVLDGEGRLYVSEHGTGIIHGFDLDGEALGTVQTPEGEGTTGLEIDGEGKLWYIHAPTHSVSRFK